MSATQPVFERTAGAVLTECLAMATQRGEEYQDTWSSAHLVTTLTAATLARLGVQKLDAVEMRLLLLAALVDVKMSRVSAGGAYKRDSFVDGINYLAAYTQLREEFEKTESRARDLPG